MGTPQPLTCAEAVEQFFAYLDRALEGGPLEVLEGHLETCLRCCERLEFSRKLDAFVRAKLGDAPLPADLEERIRRELER